MAEDEDLDFTDLPPFPSDIPTAPLLRISLQKLIDTDKQEVQRLWNACRSTGFFYLDLRDAKGAIPPQPSTQYPPEPSPANTAITGSAFISDAYSLFTVASEFFALPLSSKQTYDFKSRGSYHGYKALGDSVTDSAGTRDRFELYNISKDDVIGLSSAPLPCPELIAAQRSLVESYMRTAHAIVTLLLTHLNTLLGLPEGVLQGLHDFYAPAGDQTRFIRSPPQPPSYESATLGAHTDYGSVTLLFNRLGGLQILPPNTPMSAAAAWQYVRPLRNHCIVNLGDALVKFTSGILRSATHRVVPPPGDQGSNVRYSVVYFARPNDEVLLQPLRGSEMIEREKAMKSDKEEEDDVVSSKEWVLRRALGGRRGVWVGGTEGVKSVS